MAARTLVAMTAALALIGCVKSSDTKTINIKATFTAIQSANGALTCHASFMYSDSKSQVTMVLTGEDKVTCSTGTQSRVLTQFGNDLSASLSGVAPGATIQFKLSRAKDETVLSSVTTPPDFSLSTSEQNRSFSLTSDEVDIGASPEAASNEATSWSVSGSCINAVKDRAGSPSGISVAPGTITVASDETAPCGATFTVRRAFTVPAATALAPNSTVVGAQERTMSMTAEP